MRKLTIFLLFSISTFLSQAQKNRPIEINSENLTQIIFETDIEKYRGGFDPSLFSLEHYKNILYIQPLTRVNNSNLSVITTDGLIYTATVVYVDTLRTMSYTIAKTEAVNQQSIPLVSSTNIETQKDKISSSTKSQDILKFISFKPQFIYNSNGIETRYFSIYVKGIYATNEHLYFQIELTNKTHLPYNCDLITFGSRTKLKGKRISDQRTNFVIIDKYYPTRDLALDNQTLVYQLDKFSLSKEKEFTIELIEEQGERNIFCILDYDFILQARPLMLD